MFKYYVFYVDIIILILQVEAAFKNLQNEKKNSFNKQRNSILDNLQKIQNTSTNNFKKLGYYSQARHCFMLEFRKITYIG